MDARRGRAPSLGEWPAGRRRRASGTASPRPATSRVVRSRTGSTHRGRAAPGRTGSRRPASGCSTPGSSGHARCSTTRCSPSGTRCSSRRWRRPRRCSGALTGYRPRSPTVSSCSASCAAATAAGTAAGRPTALRRLATTRSPPTTPRSSRLHRLAELTGAGALDRCRAARRPTPCSTSSGTSTTAGCSRPPTTAKQLVARQKDLLDNATPSANSTAADALTRLAALTGEQRYANHADRILQLLGTVIAPGPGRSLERRCSAIETRGRGITEVAIVGDRPDLVRVAQVVCSGPTSCSPGASVTTRRCGTNAADGLAYVCRDYACEAPQDTAGGLLRAAHWAASSRTAHQPPRWMISFGRRRDRPVLVPVALGRLARRAG